MECFDATENEHRDHILKVSRVPALVSPAIADAAQAIAETIARAFDYVGVLAVEMFVPRAGETAVMVNDARWLAEPHAKVHLYGKAHVRPGRKMGHVTCVSLDPAGHI